MRYGSVAEAVKLCAGLRRARYIESSRASFELVRSVRYPVHTGVCRRNHMNRTSRPDGNMRWSRRLVVVSAVMIPLAAASAALSAEEQPAPSAPTSLGDAARKLKAPKGDASIAAVECTGPVGLYSLANNRYVSAELGYGGGDHAMLRARATVIDAWERFHIIDHGSYINIKSAANDRLVSAELGYRGADYAMLRARATEDGPWERFE